MIKLMIYWTCYPNVVTEHRDIFKSIDLFPITAIAADFDAAQEKFFAEGAIFDAIYQAASNQ